MIKIGDKAPDFTLPGIQDGAKRDYTLSEYTGRKVVLAFYPGDFTPGCTRQMCSYRDNFGDFAPTGAVLLGISPQDVESHAKWAEKKEFHFPLLADVDKTVIEAYGVGAPLIGVRRSVFVIDGEGIVRFADRKLIGATFVPIDKLVPVLDAIRG
jgi:thioredoxin-dependent peroxiredoxin